MIETGVISDHQFEVWEEYVYSPWMTDENMAHILRTSIDFDWLRRV